MSPSQLGRIGVSPALPAIEAPDAWHQARTALRFATENDPEARGKRPATTGLEPFTGLLRWLRHNVHGKGSLLSTEELVEAATGELLGTAAFGVGPSNNPESPKTVWALFNEEHVETSNGSVLGDTSLGSGGGGDTGGVTVQSSNLLPFENPSMLSNMANKDFARQNCRG